MRVQIKKRIAENAKKAAQIKTGKSYAPIELRETANISSEEFNILPRVKRPEDLLHHVSASNRAIDYRSTVTIRPDRANPTNARL